MGVSGVYNSAVDNESYQVAPEALDAMQKEIEKGKPIILLAHVPFYTSQIETLKEASIIHGECR